MKNFINIKNSHQKLNKQIINSSKNESKKIILGKDENFWDDVDNNK